MRDRIAVLAACVIASAGCVAAGAAGQPGPPPTVPPPPQAYSVPDGQWVQTQQYGWVWMPYSDAYTYAPPGGDGEPLEYVYYPTIGWAWVSAPWVWGVGPWPAFGSPGAGRFAWYERGWWRTPQRWRYRPAPERPGYAARGVRPAPVTRPAPQARTGRSGVQGRPQGERRGGERGGTAAQARPAPREGERGRSDEQESPGRRPRSSSRASSRATPS